MVSSTGLRTAASFSSADRSCPVVVERRVRLDVRHRGGERRSGRVGRGRAAGVPRAPRPRPPRSPRSVHRLGRSLTDLLGILQELRDKGVDLFLHQQGLDTSTTAGKAMFQMLGVFAEFERGIIRERVNAGLARARANGTKLGRRRVKPAVEARILELRASGDGILKIGRKLGIGTSVVQRVFKSGSHLNGMVPIENGRCPPWTALLTQRQTSR